MIVSRKARGSPEPVGSAGAADFGPDFGAAVRAHRIRLGLSLNQLAHRAGVDPAYIHRIESRVIERPPSPRRAVVLNIAAALQLDRRATDELLAQAGYAPDALLSLGGWDEALAEVADLLGDAALSGPAKAEFREVLRILVRRWAAHPGPSMSGTAVNDKSGATAVARI
jgi:transcriptional regulator with XRE-family HTH domain